MGGSKDFFTKGIFTYTAVAEVAGLKILKGTGGKHNLPKYSHRSLAYVKTGRSRGATEEHTKTVTFYRNQEKLKDLDWDHKHTNKINHRVFEKYSSHVHDYVNGRRSGEARLPSKKERRIGMMVRYGRVQ